jgi:hypothetical protein
MEKTMRFRIAGRRVPAAADAEKPSPMNCMYAQAVDRGKQLQRERLASATAASQGHAREMRQGMIGLYMIVFV